MVLLLDVVVMFGSANHQWLLKVLFESTSADEVAFLELVQARRSVVLALEWSVFVLMRLCSTHSLLVRSGMLR